MTTRSWPISEQPIPHTDWREEWSGADGIIDDLAGTSLNLTLPGSGDIATLALGKVRVKGFVLVVTSAHAVTLPAVASGPAVTYVVGIKYDPAAEGVSPGGPLSVFALTKGSYSSSGGTAYWPLYEVTRSAAQVLSGATVADQRVWVGSEGYAAAGFASISALAVGSRLHTPAGDVVRTPAGWVNRDRPAWVNLSLIGSLQAYTSTPQYTVVRGEVVLRGGIQHATVGQQIVSANTAKSLFILPAGARPGRMMRFPMATTFAGVASVARCTIDTDGRAEFAAPVDDTTWCHIDGIRFFAEN